MAVAKSSLEAEVARLQEELQKSQNGKLLASQSMDTLCGKFITVWQLLLFCRPQCWLCCGASLTQVQRVDDITCIFGLSLMTLTPISVTFAITSLTDLATENIFCLQESICLPLGSHHGK